MGELVRWLLGSSCAVCGRADEVLCRDCRWRLRPAATLAPVAPLTSLQALVRYDDAGRDLVLALKYHNRRAVVPEVAVALAVLVPASARSVTWVATTGARRRARGFDQARLLAEEVAAARGLPLGPVLRRLDGHPQTGRDRRHRLEGPRFDARRPAPAVVALVDDVVTTGSSLASGARALRAAGASEVHGIALAHTPLD